MKSFFRIILFITLSSCLTFTAISQSYKARYITTRDGLASGFVGHIYQDHRGYVWISTVNGLSKYNGYDFVNYRSDVKDSASISGSRVLQVVPFDSTHLMVASRGGLDLFDLSREAFYKVKMPKNIPVINSANRAVDIKITKGGDTWVSSRKGLYHFPKQTASDTLDAQFYPYYPNTSEVNTHYAIAFDPGRQLIWVGMDSLLQQFDLTSRSFQKPAALPPEAQSLIASTVWHMHATRSGTLIIISTNGVLQWEPQTSAPKIVRSFDRYLTDTSDPAFQSIWEDENGLIYLGTARDGAFIWDMDSDEVTIFQHEEGSSTIASNDVHYFFKDRDNNYWFGHHDLGLSLLYSSDWEYTYEKVVRDKPKDHPLNKINDVIEFEEGLLFATYAGLVYQQENKETEIYTIDNDSLDNDSLDNDSLLSYNEVIKTGQQALVHISERGFGGKASLFLFDLNKKFFEQIAIPDSIKIFSNHLNLENQVIFGTQSQYLVAINKSDYSSVVIGPSGFEVPENEILVTTLGQDSEQNIMVLLLRLTSEVSAVTWQPYLLDQKTNNLREIEVTVPDNINFSGWPIISHTRRGTWYTFVGTGILQQQVFEDEYNILFTEDAGVLAEGSTALLEDNKGFLWMTNLTGLMKLDPVTEAISFYELDEDRRPNEFGLPIMTESKDVYAIGEGGYVKFNPNDLEKVEPINKVMITEINAGNNIYSPLGNGETLSFGSSVNNLSFSYLGINYRNPLLTRYRYRMLGYDDEWINVGAQRRVFLANLPSGQYTFQVQAAGKNGGFSDKTGEVSFKILPPWWQTTYAYIGYGLLFIGIIFLVDRVQRKRVLEKERERSREKELKQAREIEKAYQKLESAYQNLQDAQEQLVQQEKLASLGQLTAGIAHEIKNPLNFVNNFSDVSIELIEEAREELEKTKNGSGELKDLLNDIESNVKKIYEHGQRADGIVKSMLQ
ncbi:MAG: triple tyrosine motif-containing protein, partial [Fulvivirga sp.]|nr:triple tyrosine motif-containing protein [Fulvivirga sp.]